MKSTLSPSPSLPLLSLLYPSISPLLSLPPPSPSLPPLPLSPLLLLLGDPTVNNDGDTLAQEALQVDQSGLNIREQQATEIRELEK